METCDVLIVGGGAAGMACALSLLQKKKRIVLADRNDRLGGVLLQCRHTGFGGVYFGTEMTGVEYAKIFAEKIEKACGKRAGFSGTEDLRVVTGTEDLCVLTGTEVQEVRPDKTALLCGPSGRIELAFETIVFATGCRERTLQSLLIEGTRPAGVMTAGTAQKLMNLHDLDVEDGIVILGTGDIGQIMARQLVQAGKHVLCMVEMNDRAGGRKKNRIECIEAYDIPVMLHSTITGIYGSGRIESVIIKDLQTGKESLLPCGTLLTAIGLIPEMELAASLCEAQEKKALPDWAFKVGNCDYVHDIVDSVTLDAERLFS